MTDRRLEIMGLGRRAEGLAVDEGRTVFVPYGLPGETILATMDGERAKIVRIENVSPARVEPFCQYFGTCGGCQLQHWNEKPYRMWKRGLVETALRRRGIEVPVGDLIDAHGAGRRRVSLHVRRKNGEVTAGFMAARSHALLDIERCPIVVPQLAGAMDIARALGEKLGDCDVALTATAGGIDAAVKAERMIAEREAPKLASLGNDLDLARLTVNGDIIVTRAIPSVKMGRGEVMLPPASFLQATEAGETRLAECVIAAIGKAKYAADLFCGCGPFALRLAATTRVAAFDNDKWAIAALGQAARATPGLKPIETAVRDLFREPLVANELQDFDAVVFDPPRAGAEAQARQIAKSKVKTVIAVSCDPVTLARDAEILAGGGFRIEVVTPIDQFKWTSHVETVAVFRKT
ncbi:MAG: class I SAM-dependent RNA methyltransferase [Aestuariivirga sp.]